jgi:hypothetical protein
MVLWFNEDEWGDTADNYPVDTGNELYTVNTFPPTWKMRKWSGTKIIYRLTIRK